MKKDKTIFPIIIFFVVFGLLAYGMYYLFTSDRPTPATPQQVNTALAEQGFQPLDITDTAMQNFPNMGLESCIIAEQNDIRFDFYQFDNVNSARKVYQQAHTKIIDNRTNEQIKFREGKLNYRVYILNNKTNYYLSLYTENTAVYAYCASENSGKINAVLNSLGYIEANGNDLNSGTFFDKISRIIAYAILIPVMYITRIWIWPVLYKSAGATRREVLEMGDSRKEIIPKLIKRSKNPKQTKIFAIIHNYISLPAYIATVIAVIACFTDVFDKILDTLGILIPGIMVCCAFVFVIIDRTMKFSRKK